MALTDEEQQKLDEINRRLDVLQNLLPEFANYPKQAATLGKLDTRGKKPDLSRLTDQELNDIFDRGKSSPDINTLDHSHDYSINKLGGGNGPKSGDLSREKKEEIVDTWLQARDYAIPPQELAAAQINVLGTVDRGTGGTYDMVKFDYMNLQEAVAKRGEVLKDPETERKLKEFKEGRALLVQEADSLMISHAVIGVRGALEVGAKQGLSAKDAKRLVNEVSGLVSSGNVDISGLDLTGLDVSECDLSSLNIDSHTLARTTGFETATGVDNSIKEAATMLKPMIERQNKLEKDLDRLNNKPSLWDHIKAIRHGGLDNVKERLIQKIDEQKQLVMDAVPENQRFGFQKIKEEQKDQSNVLESSLSQSQSKDVQVEEKPTLKESQNSVKESENNSESVDSNEEDKDLNVQVEENISQDNNEPKVERGLERHPSVRDLMREKGVVQKAKEELGKKLDLDGNGQKPVVKHTPSKL